MSAPTSAVGGGDKQSRNLIPPKTQPHRSGAVVGREETNLQVVFLGGPWERLGLGGCGGTHLGSC